MVTLSRRLAVIGVVLALLGCSKQVLQRTGYETLHNISDIRNDKDPNYDPGRPSFETYQQQREEILRDRRPEPAAPIVPLRPANP